MLGVLNWSEANEIYIYVCTHIHTHTHTCISHVCTNDNYNIAMWVHMSSSCNSGEHFRLLNSHPALDSDITMKSPIQSTASQSHSVWCSLQLPAAVLLPSNNCMYDLEMDYSLYLNMPVSYNESLDWCHGQLSDSKFQAMLWSETEYSTWNMQC